MLMLLGFSSSLLAEENVADVYAGSAERGSKTFQLICVHCHKTTYDESRVGAPGLKGVLERHDEKWFDQWLKSPEDFA
ncbi:MAG: hypothetical protein R8K22_07360 [Mariprofundaceae bacterium]